MKKPMPLISCCRTIDVPGLEAAVTEVASDALELPLVELAEERDPFSWSATSATR